MIDTIGLLRVVPSFLLCPVYDISYYNLFIWDAFFRRIHERISNANASNTRNDVRINCVSHILKQQARERNYKFIVKKRLRESKMSAQTGFVFYSRLMRHLRIDFAPLEKEENNQLGKKGTRRTRIGDNLTNLGPISVDFRATWSRSKSIRPRFSTAISPSLSVCLSVCLSQPALSTCFLSRNEENVHWQVQLALMSSERKMSSDDDDDWRRMKLLAFKESTRG